MLNRSQSRFLLNFLNTTSMDVSPQIKAFYVTKYNYNFNYLLEQCVSGNYSWRTWAPSSILPLENGLLQYWIQVQVFLNASDFRARLLSVCSLCLSENIANKLNTCSVTLVDANYLGPETRISHERKNLSEAGNLIKSYIQNNANTDFIKYFRVNSASQKMISFMNKCPKFLWMVVFKEETQTGKRDTV